MVADDKTLEPSLEDDLFLRRIPPEMAKGENGTRPSRNAFADSRDGSPMSVYVERILHELGKTADDVLTNFEGYSLVGISGSLLRELNLTVVIGGGAADDPLGQAHASVVGGKPGSVQRRMAMESERPVWRGPR
jgi:hypothetical protein